MPAQPRHPPLNAPLTRWVGDRALLIEAGENGLEAANAASLSLYRRLAALALPEIEDVIPGARTVLVLLRPGLEPGEALYAALYTASMRRGGPDEPAGSAEDSPGPGAMGVEPARDPRATERDGAVARLEPRLVEVPVQYGGADGPDLEAVAAAHDLPVHAVIERHSGPLYTVGFIGFSPGFPYLMGLPGELATPRLSTPRTRVPAGSVAIGGEFTGIYPRATPGGWRLIGRTGLELFNPGQDPPALLRPGDRVRFVPR